MVDYNSIEFNGYPVHSAEDGIEPAFQRYLPMPTPLDVYNAALMGIPKIFPLTGEPIPVDMAETYLTSAVSHIEADLGCDLSPTVHYHPADYINGLFSNNFTGIILPRWPASKIIQIQMKFPHTTTNTPYQTYTIPAGWVSLRKNKVNVVAAIGAAAVKTDNSGLINTGGILSFWNTFQFTEWQPNIIEVVYESGFESEKIPGFVSQLIKAVASKYMLEDLLPVIAPSNSVSVGLDSVSQSATLALPQLLQARIQFLDKKIKDLSAAFRKLFGKSVAGIYIGT